ncbi:MAG TPA: tryptophan synthase subunit alpha [Sediminibacterium sp.]|jgi:tryptophan synthase alpha chain|uniref:tryptophan synthase subunit alpha n=1 Tax=Sediminibacterium sp. TaxID=1917865 RepID=UPI0008BB26A0|nr:tryptophan synthase subunit alpha [Sediminibacterium sp.]OHC85346.1 MAG: tryptophan synthase subunit alpha [Sphingobacteriia bacterium RIFOXYC2_FULL_35_18]OHC89416.1 MAG: tryptophan synthase subunit alpha [Sphingobacteriia bacterium RIFOXYD2_FULL_35_12]OYY10050.1 MAG: tryptophan synthase subunit alpha [Sphingobacteriia bacterium 35-36-14]OYZ53774.1 MAG: tryptophan synthase subunit alpha [Sphingobacteriia bacterium 24-36-13]OZA65747.1 MAG: tryptophan synthase subunit alpha [Sphingobacteriia 
MSRIQSVFSNTKQPVLNIYFTAGYPTLDSTLTIMDLLAKAGVDIIEIGMPYSDPLADGPVIQESSGIAIANGMSIEVLFSQLKSCRSLPSLSKTGIVLMGYMNPVLQYGFKRFCTDAAAAGVDGLILPDLPEYEFEKEYGAIIKAAGLDFIFLVTPETSEDRIRKLDGLSTGFLYAVSSSATTGSETSFEEVVAYLQRLQSYQLKNPIMVGFGIKDKESFNAVATYSQGAIIGSAFIKALSKNNALSDIVASFVKLVRP